MRTAMLSLLVAAALSAGAVEVVSVPPWEFHNSFWMSLHQTLIADAMKLAPRDLSLLEATESETWLAAVAAYRAAGEGDLIFARNVLITTDAITQVADDARTPEIDGPLGATLRAAAPVYRKHWWPGDEVANRFHIGYAAAMLRDAGAELVKQHETVYGAAWPARIRTFITPFAGSYGAYTMEGRSGGVITSMSSRDPGYRGLNALEMLLHESSHAIVHPVNGPVARAIASAAEKRGIEAPRDLWHAILFATSSELTRRLLITRGVPDFVPSSEDLLTRAWPQYRQAIELHWNPYLAGEGTLAEAIDRVVEAIVESRD